MILVHPHAKRLALGNGGIPTLIVGDWYNTARWLLHIDRAPFYYYIVSLARRNGRWYLSVIQVS